MSAARLPSIDEQIDEVKGYIAELAKRMATLDEKRRAAWMRAVQAYREKLAELSQAVRFVVRDVLYSKIVAASAPWAPVPRVTAPQLGVTYPLRTRHPVLGEIPFVQSMVTELSSFDVRYLDIIDAIVEGNWRLVYGGEEFRPVTTAHFQTCNEFKGDFYTCIGEPLDGQHKCIKYFAWYECAVHTSSFSIKEEGCDITVIIFEGHEQVVGCLTDKCCSRDVIKFSELESGTDYDWAGDYPAARVIVLNGCSKPALLVTPYGDIAIQPNSEADLVVAQFRGMREACVFRRT